MTAQLAAAVAAQMADHVLSGAVVVNHADKCRAQSYIRNIFRDIAADTAVRLDHAADIPAAGNKFVVGVTLDIHKNSTENDNAHGASPLSDLTAASVQVLYEVASSFPYTGMFFIRSMISFCRNTLSGGSLPEREQNP